jgi:hypothetical protein
MRTRPRDLIGRTRHPLERVPRWAWISFATTVLVVTGGFLQRDYAKVVALREADAREWRIDGPPCPRSSLAEFVGNHHRGPRSFTYEGVTFFRRHGHVECAPIYEKGGHSDRFHPVCQFTSPEDLMVRTDRGDFYFRPGPGQPATIRTTGRADPTCVMASKLTLANFSADNEQLARELAESSRR